MSHRGRANRRGGENQIIPDLACCSALIQKLMLFESHLPPCPAPAATSSTAGQRSGRLQPGAGAIQPRHRASSQHRETANTRMMWLERAADWWLKDHRGSTEIYRQKKGSELKGIVLPSPAAGARGSLRTISDSRAALQLLASLELLLLNLWMNKSEVYLPSLPPW